MRVLVPLFGVTILVPAMGAAQADTPVPVNRSFIAFTIPEKDLLPENVAYDPVDDVFFVGSTRKGKIVRVDRTGTARDFVTGRAHGMWMIIGMKVDAARRRLWVASSGGDNLIGYDREGSRPAGIFRFDLPSGRLSGRWVLDDSSAVHFFNDLVVNDAGDVFATHMFDEAAIYTIRHGAETLERFVQPDAFSFPNGITITDDGRTLIVTHREGLSAIDVATREVTRIALPAGVSRGDVDGLYYHEGSVVAIESDDRRVRRYRLDAGRRRVESVETLEAHHPMFNNPTTGVVVGDTLFYIANAQFGSFNEDGTLFPMERLFEVIVLRMNLN